MLRWAFQLAVVGMVAAFVVWLLGNYRTNSDRQNIPTGYEFLDQPAGFPIPGSDFRVTQPVSDALWEGFFNTLRLAVTGIILATVFGILIGIARLSHNVIVRSAARGYVEFVRNIPLLGVIGLIYIGVVLNGLPSVAESWTLGPLAVVNVRGIWVPWFDGRGLVLIGIIVGAAIAGWAISRWRQAVADRTGAAARGGLFGILTFAAVVVAGWLIGGYSFTTPELDGRIARGGIEMDPAYFAALSGLVIYTSSHIAEITRGSIQAVPRGQGEAADALALSPFQRMWHVVLPQAMRIAVPPMGNQYLNISKNSSLAAAVSFPELTKVAQLANANRAPAVPVFTVILVVYLLISLTIALVVNIANRKLAVVER